MAIRIQGLNSGLDTDSIVQELVSAYRTKQEKYTKAQKKLSWKQDAWKEMNTKIYNFYSKTLSNMRMAGNYKKKATKVSDGTKASVSASSSVLNGTQMLEVKKLATAGYLTGAQLESAGGEKISSSTSLSELGVASGSFTVEVGGKQTTIEVTADMTVGDFTKALSGAGISANFDAGQQRFIFSSMKTGEKNDFTLTANDEQSLQALSKLGLATEEEYSRLGVEVPGDAKFAVKQNASNAEIVLNGATYEGETNEFTINGLSITATGVTDGPVSITTSTDVDGVYDMIKGFFKEYNEIMNAMEKAYNAESAKDYEPLTDDEKEALTDKEAEEYEAKIKDSILRRDDTLRSIMNSMSMNMSKAFAVGDKKYSLASFGIQTSGYMNAAENETYAYHINGDEDDAAVSANEDKLKKMIAEDPDGVADFFTQLANSVYDSLHERMQSTTLSSAYKVYNDKQMQKEYDDYSEQIKKWEEKLEEMEESWYQKFADMEAALGQLQSQSDSLTSLLGG